MPILVDHELVELVQRGSITTFSDPPRDWFDKKSPIQPASVDLHIGKIFIPEVEGGRKGGINNPKTDAHILHSGETALVEIAEELNVPSNIAGFGFPPASMAVKGILMTNPGHIDPGFKGRITCTLINMSKESFTIRVGDPIFTTIWVELAGDVSKDYFSRTSFQGGGAKHSNLDVLSKDFLNVDRRAERRAKTIAKKYIAWASLAAVTISGVFTMINYSISNASTTNKRVDELKTAISVLEVKLQERNTKQVVEMEKSIDSLKSKLEAVEKKLKISEGVP